jgi:hypothetical protein
MCVCVCVRVGRGLNAHAGDGPATERVCDAGRRRDLLRYGGQPRRLFIRQRRAPAAGSGWLRTADCGARAAVAPLSAAGGSCTHHIIARGVQVYAEISVDVAAEVAERRADKAGISAYEDAVAAYAASVAGSESIIESGARVRNCPRVRSVLLLLLARACVRACACWWGHPRVVVHAGGSGRECSHWRVRRDRRRARV